jgi:hypothetical protein
MQTTPLGNLLSTVSGLLQRQWPTVDPTRLDDLALDLWRDAQLDATPGDWTSFLSSGAKASADFMAETERMPIQERFDGDGLHAGRRHLHLSNAL